MKTDEFYAKGYYAGLAAEPRFSQVINIASTLKCKRFLEVGCGDIPQYRSDNSSINQLGWRARYNSDEAVREAVRVIVTEIS